MKKGSKETRFTSFHMVYTNLVKQKPRTFLMIFIVFILSFSTYLSTVIIESLDKGLNSTIERIGADIIVVPEGYISSVSDSLFSGKPCTVHFGNEWLDKVSSVEGISKTSSQIFIATLSNADCCDEEVQIIALDPDTDFAIQPWIHEKIADRLKTNEIIIGDHLKYQVGDTAVFYDQGFIVTEKLEETGMGYDSTVFMSSKSAKDLIDNSQLNTHFGSGKEDMISTILIKVEDGFDKDEVSSQISSTFDESIKVYTTSDLVGGISDSIEKYSKYSGILLFLLTIMGILFLVSIFAVTINERKREFGILCALGATRTRVIVIIAGEATLLCILGCVIGSVSAQGILFTYKSFLSTWFDLPFLEPDSFRLLWIFGKCLFLSVGSGITASLYASYKISSIQPHILIQGSE